MAQLVTLAEVHHALRLSSDDNDPNLLLLIEAASGAVLSYLKTQGAAFVGEDGEVPQGVAIPAPVKFATVYLVGAMMRNPDNNVEAEWQPGYLPAPVVSLLYPFRDPALA